MFTATRIDEELDINDERVSPYGSTLRTFDATDYSSIGKISVCLAITGEKQVLACLYKVQGELLRLSASASFCVKGLCSSFA